MEKKLAVIVDNNEEITTGNDGTEMCSSGADVAVEMCSPESHDTCGDGVSAVKKKQINNWKMLKSRDSVRRFITPNLLESLFSWF